LWIYQERASINACHARPPGALPHQIDGECEKLELILLELLSKGYFVAAQAFLAFIPE
jgi:hypothetical protein